MNQYRALIYDHQLYPISFIREYGERNPAWNISSDRTREKILRTQMCCILIANMQYLKDLSAKREHSTDEAWREGKRIKISDSQISGSSSASTLGIEEMNDPGVVINPVGEPYPEPVPQNFRIVVLRGDPLIERKQNNICKAKRLRQWDSLWDLWDRDAQKFIMVTVGVGGSSDMDEYEMKKTLNPGYTSHISLNVDAGVTVLHKHPGGLSGIAKASDFLIRRKRVVSNLGLLESELADSSNVIDAIFCNDRTNKMVDDWVATFWPRRHDPLPIHQLPNTVDSVSDTIYDTIHPEQIMHQLEDATTI